GLSDSVPMIEVWNKIDRLDPATREAVLASAARHDQVQAISAVTGEGLDALLAAMTAKLETARHPATISLSFAEGRKRAWLHDQGVVEAETQTDDGFDISVLWTARQEKRFRDL
ncbi:MAG: GTPase HflX, partial [Paracoccaceae bacterium]|nr:GTPase HflX [Paracoccaceae bacterium]